MKAPLLFAFALAVSGAARADVVDLSKSSERSDSELGGFAVRAEFGNEFAPYGLVGAALSFVAPTGTAFEGGAGAGFPGVQLGFSVRQLFATGRGINVVIEIGIAGNTTQQRASHVVTGSDTSRYIWTNLGGGFELRPGRFSVSAVATLSFTPADGEAHFGIHGGVGYYFF